jgi:hypothetical protein
MRIDLEREKYNYLLEMEKNFQKKLEEEIERKRPTLEKEFISKFESKMEYDKYVIRKD